MLANSQPIAAEIPPSSPTNNATAECPDTSFDTNRRRLSPIDSFGERSVGSRILGSGSYAPDQIVTNDDLARQVDTSDSWIRTRTGIRQRRRAAVDQNTSDLAAHAAEKAIAAAGIDADEVDLIIVSTVTPDQPLPATAIHVKEKLGISNHCPAFDIAAACSGFIYGLHVADSFIKSGAYRRVLLIGVELLSRVVNWRDRESCVLFGDGAGAVVLARNDELVPEDDDDRGMISEIISTKLYSDSSMAGAIQIPAGGSAEPITCDTLAEGRHFVTLEGRRVFKFAVEQLTDACREILKDNELTVDEIDWVVPHQANVRILQMISEQCQIPMNRFLLNIEKYGNTSSASCPLALDEGNTGPPDQAW